MMTLLRSLFILVVLALPWTFANVGVRADPANDAMAFVDELVHQRLQLLNDKHLSSEERECRLTNLLEDNFDIDRIARFVLGRYWGNATPEEREGFRTAFKRWIVRTYGKRLSDYSADDITLTGMRPTNEESFRSRAGSFCLQGRHQLRFSDMSVGKTAPTGLKTLISKGSVS